jgi:hypothetical protein
MSGNIQATLARFFANGKHTVLYTIMAAGLILTVLVSISTGLPDNEIRVTSFEPTGRVGLRTNITVKFSKPMVPRDSLDKPVLDPPIIFAPPIRGLARWVETDVLRFFPDNELLPATEYRATVASDKTWASGFKIVNKEEYVFRTPTLTVTARSSTSPDSERPSSVRIVANLQFNFPVNASELRRSITIRGEAGASHSQPSFVVTPLRNVPAEVNALEGPATDGQEAYDTEFILTTEAVSQTDDEQQYTLRIARGLGCRNCGIPLAEQFSFALRIEPKPQLVVHSLHPQTFPEGGTIHIYLSSPVSSDEAAAYITVEPRIEYTLEVEHHTLILRGNFEPGASATVNIAKGLRSLQGPVLEREFSSKVVFPDLQPSVSFSARAIFLPKEGNGLLEFKSVNIGDVAVEVEHVFANNLVYFLTSGYGDRGHYYGTPVYLGRSLLVKNLSLDGAKNEPLLTTVDLKSIVGDTSRGIFKVSVRDKEQRWIADSRYAMITDIGISARISDDYLMVWANSLAQAEPIGKATVTLISKNNQPLVEGKTDSRGIAVFANIRERLSGFEPYVITVSRDGDLAYLRLDETLLPVSDFDVAGRPYLASGYEAFLYGDRGIYRPGDTAHFVSIVRGAGAATPPAFPYFLTVYDNRGRKFTSARVSTEGPAIATFDFPVPEFATTGKYSLAAEIGEELQIGRTEFLVEEFMPDRIKVTLTTPSNEYDAGDTIRMGVNAKYLFGPAAASHRVSGHLTIESYSFSPSGWSEYTFVNSNQTFKKMEVDLPDALLNDTGGYSYRYPIPSTFVAPSALKGLLSATVSEEGGRGVSAYTEVKIHPYRQYVGLRLSTEGYAKINEPIEARLIAVGADGRALALPRCDVRFYRVAYNTVLKKDKTGVYRYMSERKTYIQDSATVSAEPDGAQVSFVPHDYGSYEIVASDPQGGHSSAVSCYASGWGYAPWAMTNPDKIELQLDKQSYSTGEKAIVQVRSPFGGKLLVTVEKEEVLETITRDMAENTAEIEIPVRKEHFPNAYVTATVIRPAAALEPNMPARAFGLVPLRLVTDNERLAIAVSAPEVIRPKSTVTIDLKVDRPKETYLTLAAVDAGILQLTDYTTPDPMEFFYGKKQPRLKPYDLYSFVYPNAIQSKSHLGVGDKMFAASRLRHLNPVTSKRVRPVALWSGLIKTDVEGRATVSFTLPEFNGKLVLMAVGAQGDMFGSTTREMTVRDKIVLQESFPRFVSPNDVFDGLVTLFNNTGARADISVTANADGPAEFVSPTTVTVALDNNREGAAVFKVRAKPAPGRISFTISATAGEEESRLSIEMPNRPALPLVTLHGSGAVVKGSPAEFTLPGGWLPGTDQYVLKTSSLPAVSFARNVQYLLSYPYGCVEQITSRLFPLLYFDDLVRVAEPGLFGGRGHEYFIQEGILQLNGMVLPDRSFAYWPGSDRSNNWATVYASHFLSEAAKAGYYIDKRFLEQVYDHLEDIARGRNVRDLSDVHRIYAAYVLAQAGRLEQREVTYLRNVNPDKLAPFSRYQLAGALALSGNLAEATHLVPMDVQPNVFEPETGGDFNSAVRTDAILLETVLTVDPNSPSIDVLAQSLMERATVNQWYTTQDNAFALMALGKYFRKRTQFGYSGSVTIEGVSTLPIDSTGFSLTRKDIANRRVSIEVDTGDGACFYYWQASGVPEGNAAPEFDHGIIVRRAYLSEDAAPIDPDNVRLGDRVVCVITAETVTRPLQNVVINDLLPAGFEIENPRLKTSPRLSWIPEQSAPIDFQDIRDDRLLAFTNLYPGQKLKHYYSLRAIAAGEFKVPPIASECMYNPLIGSSSSSGAITIVR